jgi:hypothetical protein
MSAIDRNPSCYFCGQRVALPQKGWQPGAPAYCEAHRELEGRDPGIIVPSAVHGARHQLTIDPKGLPSWPWYALDEMAGLLVPESVTYVAAFPGNGKTSKVSHCVLHWIKTQGLRVLLLPLEADPREALVRLVCLEVGIDPDEALSFRLRRRADAGDVWARRSLDALDEAYVRVLEEPRHYQNLMIEPADTLSPAGFTASLNAGHAAGVDLVVVDHVDHVGHDEQDQRSEIAKSTAIQHAAKRFARRTGTPVVLMSQLNSKATGGDVLAHYKPPRMDWLWMKGVKEQIGHTFLGLFRPMRPDLTDEELRLVSRGLRGTADIAEPCTMGVVGMKRRFGGAVRDPVVKLTYERGLITDRQPDEARGDQAAAHGIDTRPWYGDR